MKKFNIDQKAELSISRAEANLASMSARFIFISGGSTGRDYLSAVERYDKLRDTWESLPNLNEKRGLYSTCILGNTMYVLGG